MKIRILKWGNSLGLRIPKSVAGKIGLRENASVQLMLKKGSFVVVPEAEPEYDLAGLLTEITEENLHGEWETGRNEGKEIW
ncbi:MAG: AbrB/MazE/SpoVT family DNA-binding domain-containing protein [Candidatus Aminicenantes bacterium]|nr:AbrB/MazE/SpoVT family DNA-binding domain-containing protein [Candidatus Aminicenantes bacterium]